VTHMGPLAPAASSPKGVSLAALIKRLDLAVLTDAGVDLATHLVTDRKVNRPGLQWAGYSEHFPTDRIQVIGRGDVGFLQSLEPKVRLIRLEQYAQLGMPAIIVSRNLEVSGVLVELAEVFQIPVLRTEMPTSEIVSQLEAYLALELAPRHLMHAGLVDVAGEGVLILGRSGIGKSETALELIRRGHRLIADDTVEVRRPSEHELIGMAPGRMRHFMEIKGIGIVNLRLMYGISAMKSTGDLSLAVSLVPDREGRDLPDEPDRMEILGVSVALVTIPVRPGRNIAAIIEAVAMDIRAGRLLRPRGIEERSDVRADQLGWL
jgi:HPr kinase/phosphorylase